MSQENVEVTRRAFEAFARGDLDWVLETMDPDIEWAPAIAPILGVEPIRGKDALRRFFTRDLVEAFDDFEAKPLSIEDLGDNVLVNIAYFARGRASRVPISLETFALFVRRGGKTVSFRDYETKAEALEAAGLSEQAMSEENVEVVRAASQAWNAGDMDAFREMHHPDVILRPPNNWPEPGPYIGREAVMGFYKRARETWENADTLELTGGFSHAADRIVARWIWHAQGHGPESNLEVTAIHTVRNGKVREVEYFWDHDEALEAVGLSE